MIIRTVPRSFVVGSCTLVVSLLGVGCQPTGGGGGGSVNTNDNTPVQGDVLSDLTAAEQAGQTLTSMLDANTSTADALAALAQQLAQDPRVLSATLGDEEQTLWVNYASGLEHVYCVIQDDPGAVLAGQAAGGTPKLRLPGGPTWQLGGEEGTYVLPASRQAIVANALHVFNEQADGTATAAKLLSDCGYEVAGPVDADVNFFSSLTGFGVVYVETGGWVEPVVTRKRQPDEYCQTRGRTMMLLTTTPVTEANKSIYMPYLECNQLLTVTVEYRPSQYQQVRTTVFGVTPNFVRDRHEGEAFPDNTLLCLTCQGFTDTQGAGSWTDVWRELCPTGRLVAWTSVTQDWYAAMRGGLNLLQLMTGGNEELKLYGPAGRTYSLLEQHTPPGIPVPLDLAYRALVQHGYAQAEASTLTVSAPLTGPELILAPGIANLEMVGPLKAELTAYTPDNAELWFNNAGPGVNIGTQTAGGTYKFDLAGGLYGKTTLRSGGRTCPPRNFIAWTIPFNVQGVGTMAGDWRETLDYQVRVRAMPPDLARESVWDPVLPLNIDAFPDPDGSSLVWSNSGTTTFCGSIPVNCRWTGSGHTAISYLGDDGQPTNSYLATVPNDPNMYLAVFSHEVHTVTVTCSIGGTTTYSDPIEEFIPLPYGRDLTIPAGTITAGTPVNICASATATWTWPTITPDPPYDPDTQPQ